VSDPACGEFRFPRVPGAPVAPDGDPRGRWPGIGDSGREILADFGFSEADIASLLGRTGAALPT
jgi:hypothetical protein